MTTGSHIGNKLFNSAQVRYDPLQSFAPVMGLIETNGMILVARKDIPADTISALNSFAKSRPNGLTTATPALATSPTSPENCSRHRPACRFPEFHIVARPPL